MRIRSFIIAYALVLAILLFADRRPSSTQQDRYSHVVDLTDAQNATAPRAPESRTRIIAPGTLIPGTWAAGQIPPERLVAPLVVIDLNAAINSAIKDSPQISLDDIAAWESHHGMIPQGAVVAIRRAGALTTNDPSTTTFPIASDAAQFLMDARYTIGFAVETPVNLTSDRTLARQLALHGSYVVERTARFTSLPATGSLIIVAPARNKKPGEADVRILAMVR
jgi:kynurenine formamidase